ncbi:MAG TPA: hypothetical protein VK085_06075 [Pseudogracilibacillus sp.]|nr:hypothetical protein [Pseudogracilibacillus sp.]
MLETNIRNYLLEIPEIKDVIGNRIYPEFIPENADFPAIAYNEISNPSHHDIDVAYPRIQYSCFSHNFTEAKLIRSLLKKHLKRFKGQMGDKRIIQIVVSGEYPMPYEADRKIYGRAIDFKIIYWE